MSTWVLRFKRKTDGKVGGHAPGDCRVRLGALQVGLHGLGLSFPGENVEREGGCGGGPAGRSVLTAATRRCFGHREEKLLPGWVSTQRAVGLPWRLRQ